MTGTKESLPIHLITSYLSNGLLLVSSTVSSVHLPRGGRKGSTGLKPHLSWLLTPTPGLTSATSTPLAQTCPRWLLSLRPICPCTDVLPFPWTTQTQLMIFLPQLFPPFLNPQFLINKRLHLHTVKLYTWMSSCVSLTFPSHPKPHHFPSIPHRPPHTPVVFHWDNSNSLT